MAAKLTRLTHKIAIQLHLVAQSLYHLQFSLQAASPATFGYSVVTIHVLMFSCQPDGRISFVLRTVSYYYGRKASNDESLQMQGREEVNELHEMECTWV
jgi:hypothetical protein